ncbi:MAG: peptidyl-prolyl cis-trans isomerase [Candidatus Aminicenantes bacterium]|nr:peptidyl-prolyl cis-trans isomerase [Candidatus Aminicenantes bacterium]
MMNKWSPFSAAVLATAAVLCLGAGACGKKAVPPPLAEGFRLDDPERAALPILTVEDVSFVNADFARFAQLTLGEPGEGLTAEAAGRLFEDFIRRKLIIAAAAARDFVLSEEDKAAIAEGTGSGASVGQAAQPGREDFLEGALVEKYLTDQVRNIGVSDEEIVAYYEEHRSDFLQPERLQVSQILFSTEGKAGQVLNRLRNAGERLFREAAQTDSEGPEADKGGLMGVFSLGQLPPDLEKVIFALDEGKISRVVQSAYGFHIFRLDKKFEQRLMPVEEAAGPIRAKLLERKNQAAIDAHLASLKEKMKWEVIRRNLPFIYENPE